MAQFSWQLRTHRLTEKYDYLIVITEQRNPNSIDIDLKSISEIVQIFHQEDQKAIDAVVAETESISKAIEMIVTTFQNGGRLFYIGAGTSGRLGVLDASECPPTFSTSPEMVQGIIAGGDTALRNAVEGEEDKPERGADAIREHKLTKKDLLVGIATSGRTPYVLGALNQAHTIGVKTIFFSCVPPAEELKEFVDHFITPIVGPEIITGSTRLKAGTATKLVLNMLTTVSMVKIGKVHNNLMVDVNATNTKLIERSIRIVQSVTGVDPTIAQKTLKEADGNAKIAIVMLTKVINKHDAIKLLDENQGLLRPILD